MHLYCDAQFQPTLLKNLEVCKQDQIWAQSVTNESLLRDLSESLKKKCLDLLFTSSSVYLPLNLWRMQWQSKVHLRNLKDVPGTAVSVLLRFIVKLAFPFFSFFVWKSQVSNEYYISLLKASFLGHVIFLWIKLSFFNCTKLEWIPNWLKIDFKWIKKWIWI